MTENLLIPTPDDSGEFILYQTDDGQTRIEVRMAHETIWLSQRLIADLFQVSVPTVNEHLKGIFEDRELDPSATIRKFRIVRTEGQREVARNVDHYNLDDFLKLSDCEILTHAGKISHDDAKEKAEAEFAVFKRKQAALPQPVDVHFEQSLDELKKIETQARASMKKATKKPRGTKRSGD